MSVGSQASGPVSCGDCVEEEDGEDLQIRAIYCIKHHLSGGEHLLCLLLLVRWRSLIAGPGREDWTGRPQDQNLDGTSLLE